MITKQNKEEKLKDDEDIDKNKITLSNLEDIKDNYNTNIGLIK